MRIMKTSLFKRLRRFGRSSDGGVTVEFVLWMPFFMAMILMIADVSMVFMRQSTFWNVSRDTARIVARHGMGGAAAADYAQSHATFGDFSPEISIEITATEVTVIISALTSHVAPFGFFGFSDNARVTAQVTQALEPL